MNVVNSNVNSNVNILNTEINYNNLYELLLFIINRNDSKKYTFERIGKINNLNIKLTLKLTIHVCEKRSLSVDISVLTESCMLRKNRYLYDEDNKKILKLETITEKSIDTFCHNIIYTINNFQMCEYCKNIINDKHKMNKCLDCRYDSIFDVIDINCAICRNDLQKNEQSYTLTCGHSFHTKCISNSFFHTKKRECPLCKQHEKN